MRVRQATVLLFVSILIFSSPVSKAADNLPARTFEGLELVSDGVFTSVYIEPGFNLSQYNRIYLDDAYIAFKKNWQSDPEQSSADRVNAGDMDKIKVELMLLFRDVFSRTLQDNGYQLTTEIAEDVLRIKPAIINLEIVSTAGKTGSNVVSYSQNAAEMTLYLELYDSLSGDIIAKAVENKRDRQTGHFKWQNRISNRAAARRILQVWADALKQGLDQARGVTGPASR